MNLIEVYKNELIFFFFNRQKESKIQKKKKNKKKPRGSTVAKRGALPGENGPIFAEKMRFYRRRKKNPIIRPDNELTL